MNYKELNLSALDKELQTITINGHEIPVLPTLSIRERISFVEFIIENSIDETTGCFSPVRIEVFFSLALVRWYAGITFEEDDDLLDAYDALEENGVFDSVVAAIGQTEYDFMKDLVNETLGDIARYNNSFAGMMQLASAKADGLDGQITEILEKVKNREGMELLGSIKDMVGTD